MITSQRDVAHIIIDKSNDSNQIMNQMANRENVFFPCPRSRLGNWSRETNSTVPSHVSPLILHNDQDGTGILLGGFSPSSQYLRRRSSIQYHQPPSGHSLLDQVTPRTDGVHHQESASTGLVVFKVAWVNGWCQFR